MGGALDAAMPSMVTSLNDESFESLVRRGDGAALVVVHANWCSNSRYIAEALGRMSWTHLGFASFYSLDVGVAPSTAFRLGISSVPAAVLICDGVEVTRLPRVNHRSLSGMLEQRMDWSKQFPHGAVDSMGIGPRRPLVIRGLHTLLKRGLLDDR